MILGVIADDFTGATDVASMLVRGGMSTVLVIGVPSGNLPASDAVVIALKSRTAPVHAAVAESLACVQRFQEAGAKQIYFKYCSTFDSTAAGNIGPVADALLAQLGDDFAIACPAFPENGRTVYKANLFVGDVPLNESGMRDHPLTPMTDANLQRVLQAQTPGRVGLCDWPVTSRGATALQMRLQQLRSEGHRYAIVDALTQADLQALAQACQGHRLITAASGLALALPDAYRRWGWLDSAPQTSTLASVGGGQAVLAGSCSQATRRQVAHWQDQGRPAHQIDPMRGQNISEAVAQALHFWQAQAPSPCLFYASATPQEVLAVQQALGRAQAGAWVEAVLAQLAQELVAAGVRRLVVAGGETSGAVTQALGVAQLRVGPSIAPGVPWTEVMGRDLLLALKSGNFGDPHFFSQALAMSA
jgi:3-dehydrotetronate 4-kinase